MSLAALVLVALCALAACSPERPASMAKQAGAEPERERFELGLLGATGHGTLRTLEVTDDHGAIQRPGGVVLSEVAAGAPLARLGLEPGDIIVRVQDDYLPNKENPTLDLLARIEQAYTAGKNQITLGYLHGGSQQQVALTLDPAELPPLNQGDLGHQARYPIAARAGLAFLKRVQRADGGFATAQPSPDAELAVASLAGLALLAGKDDAAARCQGFVASALEREQVTHLGAAFAAWFLAEAVARTADDQRGALMPALARASERVRAAQQDDGGWPLGATQPAYNESTLAAQCCVLALGAAERAGTTIDNAVFERAFAFFKKHTNDGKVGFLPEPGFDRRSEAGRLAGILVAMRGAACDLGDAYAGKLFDYYAHQSKDIAYAPLDEALGLLWSALLTREKGLPQWILFNYENQILLLSLQQRDGSFAALPKPARKALPFFDDCAGPAWRTAIYSLVLQLQDDALPVLSPGPGASFTQSRDSSGKLAAPAAPAADQAPAGATQFTSIEDAIQFMKKMGVKDDDPQMKQLKELEKKK